MQSVTWINLWMQKCQGLGVGMKVFVAWFANPYA